MLRLASFTLACFVLCAISTSQLRADDKAAIDKLEAAFGKAMVKGDGEWFKANLAENFRIVLPDGTVLNKQQYVSAWTGGKFKCSKFEISELDVRLFGDTAIAIGRGPTEGTADGKPFSHVEHWTDVFARIDGEWKCVSCHVSERKE